LLRFFAFVLTQSPAVERRKRPELQSPGLPEQLWTLAQSILGGKTETMQCGSRANLSGSTAFRTNMDFDSVRPFQSFQLMEGTS
jgi:hypothetical protein